MEAELRLMLHRAIQELAAIHAVYREAASNKAWDLIESAEGKEIVEHGMKLLGLKDLHLRLGWGGMMCKPRGFR